MNDIEFNCPYCNHSLVVDASGAGVTVNCPKCSKPIQIPAPALPKNATSSDRMVKCPYCQEEIKESAIKCKHCGSTLGAPAATGSAIVTLKAPRQQLSADSAGLISELSGEKTWKLWVLSAMTVWIYLAYYIKRQTAVINKHSGEKHSIDLAIVNFLLVVSYAYVGSLLLNLFSEVLPVWPNRPFIMFMREFVSKIPDMLWPAQGILLLLWAWIAREKIHRLTSAKIGDLGWFQLGWTFVFTALYFNYKVNILNTSVKQNAPQQNTQPDAVRTGLPDCEQELRRLARLTKDGIISAEDYEQKKKALLGL